MSRNGRSGNTLFAQLDSAQTHVGFVNHLSDTGDLNILDYLYYYNGGGVAAGDVNNDGFTDLYFVSNLYGNRLYINEGGLGKLFSFKDVSFQSGVQGAADWQTGVTMADVNGDGWLDIYVCSVSGYKGLKGSNELYINNGLNKNGEVTFTESAQEYGLAFSGFSTQAVFFDYDKDTDLDMYLLNHAVHTSRSYDYAAKRIVKDEQAGDYLFENQLVSADAHENGRSSFFRDATREAGIYQASMGYGLGIAVADFNHDGWDDIYVGNDFHEDDYYYINNGDGTFTERLKDYFGHVSRFSMGCDAADINNDGYPDLMSLDMYPADETIQKSSAGEDPFDIFRFKLKYGYYYQYSRNCLQINIGGKAFSERGMMAGVAATDWSWSTLIADYDNDGLKDIFITNGIVRRPNDLDYIKFISNNAQQWTLQNTRALDLKAIRLMPEGQVHNYLFRGTGSLHFEDRSESSGFSLPSISNGASYADLDNDGDLDLITNNINEPAGIHQNKSDVFYKNAFLKIKLNGDQPNTSGIGSKIFLKCNGALQFQQLMPTRGFLSSSEPLLLFGLGEVTSVDTVMVVWPDQRTQIVTDVSVNTTIEFNQGEAEDNGGPESILFHKTTPVLEDVTDRYALDYVHKENTYYDFDSQPLIPFQVSSEGPKLAKADVNNDGLDDFYVGGARNQAGILFMQGPGDRFSPAPTAAFTADAIFEDVDAVFFDADNDRDMDLYVVSGGNDVSHNSPQLVDRLYMNDGKGNFQRHTNNLPATYNNKSCVRPRDFDNDGDMDLFVGGRVISGSYGDAADSYLLINDGKGKFSDHTQWLAPGLKNAGMVTDARWFDWDKDGDDDLIMAGDWMPIRIFRNESNRLVEVKEIKGLELSNGFWQTLHAGDFDHDGDIDFVAGNLGMNSTLRKSAGSSIRLYVKDIDHNGDPDHIFAYEKNDHWYPVATKDELSRQLPFVRKKFTDYKTFAGKTLEEIFDRGELTNARVLTVNTFSSVYLENSGNGEFIQHFLPEEAQTSKIFSFYSEDLDDDGYADILLGGNFYGASMYQGRYDAGYGLMLKNIRDRDFQAVDPHASGFFLRGEIRDIISVPTPTGHIIVVARNNLPLKIFKRTKPSLHQKSIAKY